MYIIQLIARNLMCGINFLFKQFLRLYIWLLLVYIN